jgi:hypothetical protein
MNRQEQYKRAYQEAMDIIDQEWLDAGMTCEELDENKRLAEILDRLVGEGQSLDEIEAAWEGKSNEDILREYTLLNAPVVRT